jgi:glycosyltransferase involved in cell wall biosynthesis
MPLLGLIPEDPFHPRSWSGTAAPFFTALLDAGVLDTALHVKTPWEQFERLRTIAWPRERWSARYHASPKYFEALTRSARALIEQRESCDAVLQIGAWFSSGSATDKPCFSYHDGNAAQWYRYYGLGLLTSAEQSAHLAWEDSVYRRMTRIFVMSAWLADSFMRDFGVPRERLMVVGAGINMPMPVVPDRDFSKPRFLFVGKDFERKGGRYLLEAFRVVRRQVPAELTIVGPELNLKDEGVVCAGFLSKTDPDHVTKMSTLFANATAIVLPSIYEPFGISLTEGMAWGLPCVTVDRCAMPEIVRHGECGLVAEPENASSLAQAMLSLATDPDRCREYGAAGRKRAQEHFTWAAVAEKIATSTQLGVGA